MHSPRSIRQEFFQKWIMGLQKCRTLKKNMTILERKKAIKLSADLAMASTRNQTTRWSQALIANACTDDDNNNFTLHILDSTQCERLRSKFCSLSSMACSRKRMRSRKILKRSRSSSSVVRVKRSVDQKVVMANSIAKRLVKKRTSMLKSLVPGGEFMNDDMSLIEETLDYIEALRAQVDVMRCFASASS
ncbi:Transcription factor protein [Quillaja saponaria]|uniref:Transcription factor protein n=1 Tax=Quillaja saponaria TaxID=32244 RepID=A0AAD7LCX0_QUISA|nr:Transcription factor protein [Quillaja saponaria]